MKSYSASTGYVYQYYFYEVQSSSRKTRDGIAAGSEYTYMVSVDRKTVFALRVFLRRDALQSWAREAGRELTGTEEYAVAKMRLFQAFDEIEDLAAARPDLVVDGSNLAELLSRLDL